jgi:HK97 family phage prohead protease
MDRAKSSGPVFKAGRQSDQDPFEFVLSDESVDRHGDIVRAAGWDLSDFLNNPIALFGHAHDQIIGTWSNVHVEGKRLVGRLRMASEGTSELVDVVRKLVEQRILRAVSVGFMPLEGEPRDPKDRWGGYEFTKQTLSEASLVAVPANPNALALAKALSPATADMLFARAGQAAGGTGQPGRVTYEEATPRLERARAMAQKIGIT